MCFPATHPNTDYPNINADYPNINTDYPNPNPNANRSLVAGN